MLISQQAMRQSTHTRRQHAGFTLLELAAVLVLLSGVIFTLSYKTTDVSIQRNNQDATRALAVADEQLRHFAAWNGRLPCPDTTGNGLEDCSSSKGALPYRTLGMAAIGYVQGETPLRYGVYRNSAQQADLAVTSNAFEPVNADGTRYDMSNRNSLDFCAALEQGARQATGTAHLYTARPDGSRSAMAYMLAEGGKGDADGSNGVYDSLNGTASPGFDAPENPVTSTYDDQTAGRGFNELFSLLRCDSTMRSLHLAANAIAVEEEVIAFAESNRESAEEGFKMNAVGSAITLWGMAQAGAQLSGANTQSGIAGGLLAGATASCAAPPFVGCAMIPVHTAALSSAGTAIGLASAALVAAGTALGLQIAATVEYDRIVGKTGVTSMPSTPGVDQATIDAAQSEYYTADMEADAAEAEAQQAQAAHTAALSEMLIKKAALDAAVSQIGSDNNMLESAMRDHLYGNTLPDDYDPDNPPDPFILGAAPALDAYWDIRNTADALAGQAFEDENGNPVDTDFEADAAAAKDTSDAETANAQALADAIDAYDQARRQDPQDVQARQEAVDALKALIPEFEEDNPPSTTGLCADAACGLRTLLDEFLAAYGAERQAFYHAETLKDTAETKREAVESAYDKWQGLECAMQGYDYDTQTNTCVTDRAPGSGAQDSLNAQVCQVGTDTYNKEACDALNAPSGVPGGLVTYVQGAKNIVDILDAKGSVQ